jgi:hypothetical protein
MGRFDALTQIEENKTTHTPSPVAPSPTPKRQPVGRIEKRTDDGKKPEIMKSGNHEKHSPINISKEKPLKYSTLLDAAIIKKIKLEAAERDIKDYQVIEIALSEYFAKMK